jgi:hypothetical protein
LIVSLMAAVACHDAPPPTASAVRAAAVEEERPGALCSDVGPRRVCYRGEAPAQVARVVPSGASPASGWRCGGSGAARTCEDRARNAGAFACGRERCLQARPRLPDDGEWECVEIFGVVWCHSTGDAAGIEAGPRDLGWICGERKNVAAPERICVDLDPDRPDDVARHQCHFDPQYGVQVRSCVTQTKSLIGDDCDEQRPCGSGMHCRDGACLPARPAPACWLERDCGEHAHCLLGSCVGA